MMSIRSIQKYLTNHPRINLIQYIIRKVLFDINKCETILGLEKNPYCLLYERRGERRFKNAIYYIEFGKDDSTIGYCFLLRATLMHCAYAEYFNLIPYVNWGSGISYYDENITEANAFEYFFENVTVGLTSDIVEQASLIVNAKKNNLLLFINRDSQYICDDYEISILSSMIKKYLIFNQTGEYYILNPVRELCSRGKVLGIHVRGTDYSKNYNRHPRQIFIEDYFRFIDEEKLLDRYDFFFVATDEKRILDEFVKKYGKKVLSFDAYRSTDSKPIHYGDNKRKSGYQLGMEILKDVFMLANCDGLLAGLSNVSMIARAWNQALGLEYSCLKVFDNGINYNNKGFLFFSKRL